MMLFLAALAGAATPVHSLDEAAHALAAGRPEQARQMIAAAVAAGESGSRVDRLLADLAFAQRNWPGAFAGYKALLATSPNDSDLLLQAGLSGLRSGALAESVAILDRATARPSAGWRAWNARGVAADWQRDWAKADKAFARAAALSPDNPQVLNNLGWSNLLRGNWTAALAPLGRAARLAPGDRRIAANLDLARSAIAESLPSRRRGETNEDYAARLNDAGVAAYRRGDRAKAIAAFAQALETSDHWFTRAANNLATVESLK